MSDLKVTHSETSGMYYDMLSSGMRRRVVITNIKTFQRNFLPPFSQWVT